MPARQPEGFLATPASGKGHGILVLHAWWGMNDTITSFCERLSDSGFIAFAPDLYHGRIATDIPGAEKLSGEVEGDPNQARAEIAEAACFLQERAADDRLTIIGFSMGAYFALERAVKDSAHVRSVVVFYGSYPGDADDFRSSKASFLGHFAESDPFEPREGVDSLEQAIKIAGRPVTFHHYPGTGHWFFEPDRTDAYNKPAADLAWSRTLAFLNKPA